ncbi:AraC family transcriptional regulator [Clostridium chromiireducens]|uniref:AraC family transcriptional regulator n=1 Tax=Clostridium chromiireducens TaxID=225345 RepID=A0A399IS14_9CLOT|nr:AraC family transcriptional regulator [Clostridium chromiireducens]RII35089.1 AraC family transcriptional regulator [Clostridium chromiireducens]
MKVDWIERMNEAISYIEDNIKGNIDYEKVAKIACCPNYHFQRMFAFITEVPISQYVRRRRLTLAAFELQQSNKSVIEIALEYGYESHAAFTRAFSEFHGISPIAVRKSGAKLKACSRMSFHVSFKGGTEMDYRIEKTGPFSAVGFKYRVNNERAFDLVPSIWKEVSKNGISEKLLNLMDKNSDKLLNGVLGVSADGNWGNNDDFSYYVSVLYEKETPIDMERLNFPESQWIVFEAENLTSISKAWRRLYNELIPMSMYKLADLPVIECYYPPEHNPQNELWIPIVMKN